ncbi:hypothetical protein CDL15_Pgr008637 [Punica granatum]|uniref:Uncharacterized protein n=1 Tax=Punica granatum TaxID=22663 RepID=A0A218XDH4_PUNGR|nr:hypothetical protein CDL15_Pgr008637 [Punica granatum]
MATNMSELMALLRDQNRASLSFTPPTEHRPTVDPNPAISPTFVSESDDMPISATTHVPTVHLVSDPLSPPPAHTAIPLPPAAFLSIGSAMQAPPQLAMLVQSSVYTMLPPMVPTMNAPLLLTLLSLFLSKSHNPT